MHGGCLPINLIRVNKNTGFEISVQFHISCPFDVLAMLTTPLLLIWRLFKRFPMVEPHLHRNGKSPWNLYDCTPLKGRIAARSTWAAHSGPSTPAKCSGAASPNRKAVPGAAHSFVQFLQCGQLVECLENQSSHVHLVGRLWIRIATSNQYPAFYTDFNAQLVGVVGVVGWSKGQAVRSIL
jgi:hypothetical protein